MHSNSTALQHRTTAPHYSTALQHRSSTATAPPWGSSALAGTRAQRGHTSLRNPVPATETPRGAAAVAIFALCVLQVAEVAIGGGAGVRGAGRAGGGP